MSYTVQHKCSNGKILDIDVTDLCVIEDLGFIVKTCSTNVNGRMIPAVTIKIREEDPVLFSKEGVSSLIGALEFAKQRMVD